MHGPYSQSEARQTQLRLTAFSRGRELHTASTILADLLWDGYATLPLPHNASVRLDIRVDESRAFTLAVGISSTKPTGRIALAVATSHAGWARLGTTEGTVIRTACPPTGAVLRVETFARRFGVVWRVGFAQFRLDDVQHGWVEWHDKRGTSRARVESWTEDERGSELHLVVGEGVRESKGYVNFPERSGMEI